MYYIIVYKFIVCVSRNMCCEPVYNDGNKTINTRLYSHFFYIYNNVRKQNNNNMISYIGKCIYNDQTHAAGQVASNWIFVNAVPSPPTKHMFTYYFVFILFG